MVRYAVAFKFTHHTEDRDRFYDDVKKINLYVFDKNNLVYTTTTELSPYEEKFNIPLDLPMGNYHIIVWGNALDGQPFRITPTNFVKGVTTLAEARLTLQRKANNLSDTEFEKLFWGEVKAEIPLYVSRIDTIPLINDTKNVRVVIYWDHTGREQSQTEIFNYEDITVNFTGSNAEYTFDNLPTANNKVVYAPHHTDKGDILINDNPKDWLQIHYYPDEMKTLSDSTVYDFNTLRSVLANKLTLTVLQHTKIGYFENLFGTIGTPQRHDLLYGVDIVGNVSGLVGFSKLFRNQMGLTSVQTMQSAFDRYDKYRINVYLKYDKIANTYFSIAEVRIQDWHIFNNENHYGGAD
jgi:hypothetical protein